MGDEQSKDLEDRFDSLEATVETIKEAVEEGATKEPGQGDRSAFLSQKAEEIASREDVDLAPDQIKSHLKEMFRENDGEMDGDEEDEDEMDDEMESAAKRADEANLEKGGDGTGTAAEQTAKVKDAQSAEAGVPSYSELAATHEGDS